MRKIDPATIDLSKLAVSETGVPIGFRELLPEDIVQNGDIYDAHSGEWGGNFGERWRVQKHAPRLESVRGFYGPPENGWLKHYRLLDVPFNVPEGYGRVTGGTTKKGDIVADNWSRAICEPYKADNDYPVSGCANVGSYRLQPAFPAKNTQSDYCDVTGFQTKKQFVFDRDYKSGCDKLQVKINELTKRLRDEQTALGVRTEQLEAEQARSSDLRYVVNTLQQDLRDVRYALQASVQEAKQLEDRIETKDAIIKRTSEDCAEPSNKLSNSEAIRKLLSEQLSATWARESELRSEVSALKALLAEQTSNLTKDTGVGEGYRELHDDEIPQPGDEYSYGSLHFVTPRHWLPRDNVADVSYGKMKENSTGFKYRRKLLAPAANPVDPGVGKGYRELHDAELPTARDEFSFAPFLNVPRIWSYRGWPSTGPNETYGNLKRELGAGLQYRRKIQ